MDLRDPEALRAVMRARGHSTRSLAQATGLRSHTMIHQLLSGQRTSCSPNLAEAICSQLQVDLPLLFTETG